MTEPVPVSATTDQPASKAALIAWVVALIAIGAAVFEYQQSTKGTAMLKQANEQATNLQQQLNAAQVQLARITDQKNELQQRNMPITLMYRRAANGNGLVTIFKNNAPTPVQMSVLMINPVNHHSREANLSIPASGVQSIGETEGWSFEPGHRIRLTTAEQGSVEYVVPPQP